MLMREDLSPRFARDALLNEMARDDQPMTSSPPVLPRIADKLCDLLAQERNRALGRIAVRQGRISLSQLDEALDRLPDGRSLLDFAMELGWISPDDAVALLEEEHREDLARLRAVESELQRPAGARLQGACPEPGSLPTARIGDFDLVSPLGHGGTGEVWKAWDHKIGRWVAIKIPAVSGDS